MARFQRSRTAWVSPRLAAGLFGAAPLADEPCWVARVVVTGSAAALSRGWELLRNIANATRGDDLVVVQRPFADAKEGKLEIELRRCAALDPDIPHIQLLAAAFDEQNQDALRPMDALLVLADTAGSFAGQSRGLLEATQRVLTLLESRQGNASLPRALLLLDSERKALLAREASTDYGVSQRARAMLDAMPRGVPLANCWNQDDQDVLLEVAPELSTELLREALRHLLSRCRQAWLSKAPLSLPISPLDDLPASTHDELERLMREAMLTDLPAEQAGLELEIARVYRRHGLREASSRMLRQTLAAAEPKLWRGYATEAFDPFELQRVRTWSFEPGVPRGVCFVPSTIDNQTRHDECMLVAKDESLFHVYRHREQCVPLPSRELAHHLLRPLDGPRALLVGPLLRVIDTSNGAVLASSRLDDFRQRADELHPATGALEGQTKVRLEHFQRDDLLLLHLPTGVLVFELKKLNLIARLQRDDLLAASWEQDGRVLCVLRQGQLAHWLPGSRELESAGSLAAGLLDAAVSTKHRRIAAIVGNERRSELALFELDGRPLGRVAVQRAGSLRLALDGRALISFEDRILRMRLLQPASGEAEQELLLGEHTLVRSFFEPPPWMPVHVELSPDARFTAVLARTFSGRLPLRLNLWA